MKRLGLQWWPNWIKFAVVIIVAVAVPLAALGSLALTSYREFTLLNARDYVADVGTRHANAIARTLRDSQLQLANFISETGNRISLLNVLPLENNSRISTVNKNLAALRLQDRFLFRAEGLYESLMLVSESGNVMLEVWPTHAVTDTDGLSIATTELYATARELGLRAMSQTVLIRRDGASLRIDIIEVLWDETVSSSGREVAGYLVGRLNTDRVILNNLPAADDYRNTTTRLLLDDGTIVMSDGLSTAGTGLLDAAPVQAAFNGQSTIITSASADGEEIVTNYRAIDNVPMVLIIEGPLVAGRGALVSEYLSSRSFPIVLGMGVLLVVLVLLLNQTLTPPLTRLSGAMRAAGRGNYTVPVPDTARGDEIGQLATEFADMRQQIALLVSSLEEQVAARLRDVQITQEIGHFATTQRDLHTLMFQVVRLIADRFPNIYHAQIFLLDTERRYAVLRASTGEPGRQLLERGHRLAVGSRSVIGQVTERGQIVIARDTATSAVHKRNEFLPDTRAELAIPLRVSDTIIGALDVQSKQHDTFDEDQTRVLQTMADQIAMAIESAQLYQESVRRIEDAERDQRVSTARAWRNYMDNRRVTALTQEAGHSDGQPGLRERAVETGRAVVGEVTPRDTVPVAVPIRLRGQILGAVQWELPRDGMDRSKLQLAQDLTDRLAVSLDNARLFEDSQRATDRERMLNEITARISQQSEIDQILQTAIREVGQALRSPQVSIRLDPLVKQPGHSNGHDRSNGNGHSKAIEGSE